MEFEILDLGLVDFKKAWFFQKEVLKAVRHGYLPAALIICRHYPVITLGRSARKESILVSMDELKQKRIHFHEIERGGDVTYHGPGQLIVYPIFNLAYLKKDIHLFLRQLEETVMGFFLGFGISASQRPGLTGVWMGRKKIASIGIAIKNWVTFHGISINIKRNDLDNFCFIKPCGMEIEMTSLETILDKDIAIDQIKENLVNSFQNTFFMPHAQAFALS
ncbi:MAG: lipoyl(octanoyl) transferase LipB [Candidatus Omnitrophota bacterium]